MNTDAHHSGKAHSTHGFTTASATHGKYAYKNNSEAQHSYTQSQLQKHSTRTHGVTATKIQYDTKSQWGTQRKYRYRRMNLCKVRK